MTDPAPILTLEDADIPNDAVMSVGGITPPVCVSTAVASAGGITPPALADEASVVAREGSAVGATDFAAVKTTVGAADDAALRTTLGCGGGTFDDAAPPGPPGTLTGVSALSLSILLWRDVSLDSVDRITQSTG